MGYVIETMGQGPGIYGSNRCGWRCVVGADPLRLLTNRSSRNSGTISIEPKSRTGLEDMKLGIFEVAVAPIALRSGLSELEWSWESKDHIVPGSGGELEKGSPMILDIRGSSRNWYSSIIPRCEVEVESHDPRSWRGVPSPGAFPRSLAMKESRPREARPLDSSIYM